LSTNICACLLLDVDVSDFFWDVDVPVNFIVFFWYHNYNSLYFSGITIAIHCIRQVTNNWNM